MKQFSVEKGCAKFDDASINDLLGQMGMQEASPDKHNPEYPQHQLQGKKGSPPVHLDASAFEDGH